jgi:putative heme-binding domain-containing protein
VPRASRADVLALLAALGDAAQQRMVLEEVLAPDHLNPAERVRVLDALQRAARQWGMRPATELTRIAALFPDRDTALGGVALRLAGAWKLEKVRPDVSRLAEEAREPARRQAAVAALVDLGGPESVRRLEALAAADRSYPLRAEALEGLAALDVQKAARLAAPLLRQQPAGPGQDPSGLFTAFLQRAGGAAALAAALKGAPPSADAARVGLRVVNSLGVQVPPLLAVLQAAAGEAGKGRTPDPKEMQRLLRLVQAQGDAARGEAIFRRPALTCTQCHAIAGAGPHVGPDLATIGGSAPLDYLLDSILLPSKVVKEGYTTAHVVTTDGRALSGIVVRESPRELVLRDATHDEIVIPSKEIEEKHLGGSLMPSGLDQNLTDAELADLVRFLSELGRPGPYALSVVPVARRWQYLPAPSPSLLALDDTALGKALRDDTRLSWTAAYSLVSGSLPLAGVSGPNQEAALLRCQVEVATPGKVQLVLNGAQGLKLWVDGVPVPAAERVPLDLSRGTHTVDVRVELGRRKEGRLRCELAVPASSRAQAAFVGGR